MNVFEAVRESGITARQAAPEKTTEKIEQASQPETWLA